MNTELNQPLIQAGQTFPSEIVASTVLPATGATRQAAASVPATGLTDGHPQRESSADDCQPYWTPPGLACHEWSAELRASVAQVINPLYKKLVLNAPSEIARSAALTVVHLTWLEILDQLEIGQSTSPRDPLRLDLAVHGESRPKLIERHLRLAGTKLKFCQLLQRLDDIKVARERAETNQLKIGIVSALQKSAGARNRGSA